MSYLKRRRSPDSAIGINGTKKRKFAVIDLTLDSDDEHKAAKVSEPRRSSRQRVPNRSPEPVVDAKDAFDVGVVQGPVGPIELSSDSESDDDDDDSSSEDGEDSDDEDDEGPVVHRPSIPRPTILSSRADKAPVLGLAVKIPSIPSRGQSVRSSAAFSTGMPNGLAARLSMAPSHGVANNFSDPPSNNLGIGRASSPVSSRSNKPLKMAIDFAELHRLAQEDGGRAARADSPVAADKKYGVTAQIAVTSKAPKGPFAEDSEDEAGPPKAVGAKSKATPVSGERINDKTNGLNPNNSRKRIFEVTKVNEQQQPTPPKEAEPSKPKNAPKEAPRPTLLQQLLPPQMNKDQPAAPDRPNQPRSLKSIVEAQTPKQTPRKDVQPAKMIEKEIESRDIETRKQVNTRVLSPTPIAVTTTAPQSNPWIQEQKSRKSDVDKGRYRKPEQEQKSVEEPLQIVPDYEAPTPSVEFKNVAAPKVLKTTARLRRQPMTAKRQSQTTNKMSEGTMIPSTTGPSSPVSNAPTARPVTSGKRPTNPDWWRFQQQQEERWMREHGEELQELQDLQEFRDRNKTPEEYQHLPAPDTPMARSPSPIDEDTDWLHYNYQIWRRVWYDDEDEDQSEWTPLPRVYMSLHKASVAATKVVRQKKDGYRILNGDPTEWRFKKDENHLPHYYVESTMPGTNEDGEPVILTTRARVEVRRELAPPEIKRFPRNKKGWLPRTTWVVKTKITRTIQAAVDEPSQSQASTRDDTGKEESMVHGVPSDAESDDDDFERQMEDAFLNPQMSSENVDEPAEAHPEVESEQAGSDNKPQTNVQLANAEIGYGDLPTPADTQPSHVQQSILTTTGIETRTITEKDVLPDIFTSPEIANHQAAMYVLDILFPGSKTGRLRIDRTEEYNHHREEMRELLKRLKDADELFECFLEVDGADQKVYVEKRPITGARNI